jgi:hypothetical protein
MTQQEPTFLAKINEHERDCNIEFIEYTHKYIIKTDPDSVYTSVTTWNHSHFPHFNATMIIQNIMKGKNWNPENKYWGKTAEEIKQQWNANGQLAAAQGTALHWKIECFMNLGNHGGERHCDLLQIYESLLENKEEQKDENKDEQKDEEWEYFLDFIRATPELKPYRTEWRIYHEELKMSGSIDMVYENEDGTLMIYDWKRCKEISKSNSYKKYARNPCINYLPDTNFWHYSLQLNTYKAIIEAKYDKKVTDMYLIQLHEENPKKTFEIIKVANLEKEIEQLFEYRFKHMV